MQIINPNAFESVEELDRWMADWKLSTEKQRKISQDESRRLYGKNIYQMYYDLRSELLANNTESIDKDQDDEDDIDTTYSDNIISEASIDNIFGSDDIEQWDNLVIKARNAEALGEAIMVYTTSPTVPLDRYDASTIDYLEKKWRKIQDMSSELRIRSDHTAQAIFGINNINLYNIIKNFVINKLEEEANGTNVNIDDIEHRDTININYDDILFGEMSMYFLEDDCKHAESLSESAKLSSRLYIMENNSIQKEEQVRPYFGPDEMESLDPFFENEGLYFDRADQSSIIPDRKSWYKNYIYFGSIGDASIWEAALTELYRDYNEILESGDRDKILSRKQAILEFGWNPEINFSHNAATKTIYRHTKKDLKTVNVSPYYENYEVSDQYSEESLIRRLIFTISTNEGVFVSEDMKRGYFCERSKYTPCSFQRFNEMMFRGKRDIVVHCAFINENDAMDLYKIIGGDYDRPYATPVYELCKEALSNYGYKDTGINILRSMIRESDGKCYLLYDDSKTKKPLRYNIIYQMVNEIANKPAIQLEESMLRKVINNGTIAQIKACLHETTSVHGTNVRELLSPSYEYLHERVKVGTNERGDIVIRNVQDVNTEFFKCHRNLMSYEKAQNYEGMKEELCKLKYLDNFAVKHMRNKNGKNYKEYADAHARITNDFNKYLKVVTDHEPDFNFTKYYEQSPWYDGGVTISKAFMDWLAELVAKILRRG